MFDGLLTWCTFSCSCWYVNHFKTWFPNIFFKTSFLRMWCLISILNKTIEWETFEVFLYSMKLIYEWNYFIYTYFTYFQKVFDYLYMKIQEYKNVYFGLIENLPRSLSSLFFHKWSIQFLYVLCEKINLHLFPLL